MYSHTAMRRIKNSAGVERDELRMRRAPRPAHAKRPEDVRHEFEAFFKAHHDKLVAFLCRRTINRSDAEEIAQESCIRLLDYGALDTRPERVWKTLLYRVATNLAIDRHRQNQRRPATVDAATVEPVLFSAQPQPDALAAVEQELDELYMALDAMPKQTRRIFLLSRAHHQSYRQIAAACGVSVKTVEKHISRALRRLRPIMRANNE